MEHFDAVVVGSGFGGSVMAYRLASSGMRVCLLERGKSYPPGSFSRTPLEMANNFWDPSAQHYGLFNIWSFNGMSAVVSSGLGGGSLIYANVLIRKDERWFRDPILGEAGTWPITRAELEPHYDAVQTVLKPSRYPEEYQQDNKTSAMRRAAELLGFAVTTGDGDYSKPQWFLPHLAVTFAESHTTPPRPGRVFDPGENYHRLPRETCRLCGECDVGCNYGSKNTLDYTYITLAERAGADIRPLTEVKSFAPIEGGGYRVVCVKHDIRKATRPGVLPDTGSYEVTADKLILSAGTLGSTYLLLKMKAEGVLPLLSPMLGKRFSGNGDLLMFAMRCTGDKGTPVRLNPSRAPVITSTFRFPDGEDTGNESDRGLYLQDAGYPLSLDYVWELLDLSFIPRVLTFAWRLLMTRICGEIDHQLGDVVGGRLSSTSIPLLGMGRDVPDGVMTTAPDRKTRVQRLQLDWDDRRSRAYVRIATERGANIANAMGGKFALNPLTRRLNELITVHPLGGCPMARTIEDGVVGVDGEVFNYPGLYVADGSILPGPVGANPSFTIAAVSDRIADAILRR
jgi:cholesterol oxidase